MRAFEVIHEPLDPLDGRVDHEETFGRKHKHRHTEQHELERVEAVKMNGSLSPVTLRGVSQSMACRFFLCDDATNVRSCFRRSRWRRRVLVVERQKRLGRQSCRETVTFSKLQHLIARRSCRFAWPSRFETGSCGDGPRRGLRARLDRAAK